MAHFYITTDNSHGKTVTASEPTGAHIRGWNGGVEVTTRKNPDGSDTFEVYMTSGSNGHSSRVLLGTVESPNGKGADGLFAARLRWEPSEAGTDGVAEVNGAWLGQAG